MSSGLNQCWQPNKYAGNITISQNKMIVNLAYQNTDDKRLDPLSWNGSYTLGPKLAALEQEIDKLK
jgi:hypothetical protein